MAGGKGTRLHELTRDELPKSMAPICNKSILERQIECLRDNNITEICIVTGHLGEIIQDYFGDGVMFGVSISYFHEDTPIGTAGALAHLDQFLVDPYFLLVFGDTIFDIDLGRMESFHNDRNSKATLFVHPNSHPYDSDIVILDADGRILKFDSKTNKRTYWYKNIVNAGLYILSKEICKGIPKIGKFDLEKDVLMKYSGESSDIYGYISSEYIKDAGTVDRIAQVEKDVMSGAVYAKNLSRKQKCIFLDRDGTINKYKGLIYKPDDMELYETTSQAIKLINQSPYISVIVTNQPVVARGLCQINDIEEIHNKMETLLGKEGAYVDAIEYCPHHPDKGYPEENPAYKILCDCRKPEIGMIQKAVTAMNIDLSNSWMIGDTARDIQTAKNAKMKSVLVKTGEAGNDRAFALEPDMICDDLLHAVKYILEYNK